MTGPEHYRKAEEVLATVTQYLAQGDLSAHQVLALMAEAQVHATLAVAATRRDEVLREAAEKIREVNRAATGTGSHATVVALRSHGDRLADVIDPL